MNYTAVFEAHDDGAFDVYVPDLPGCVSYGETREEAERNIAEAVSEHVAILREMGEPVPQPGNSTAFVDAREPAAAI